MVSRALKIAPSPNQAAKAAGSPRWDDRYIGNEEPTLDELMTDPVTRIIMTRDGVQDDCLHKMIANAQERLR